LSCSTRPIRPLTARKPPFSRWKNPRSLPSALPEKWYCSIANSLFSRSSIIPSSLKRTWSELAGPVRSTSADSTGELSASRTCCPLRTANASPAASSTRPTVSARPGSAPAARAAASIQRNADRLMAVASYLNS